MFPRILKTGIHFLFNKSTFNETKFRLFVTEAQFKTTPFRLHRLDKGPLPEVSLKRSDALTLYERMSAIRKMENQVNALYKAKLVRGFCHLYVGQEAVAVGIFSCLRPQDTAITSYRNHAWAYLFEDQKMEKLIGELIGVQCGSERGKGGSMHMYTKNFYGGQAIVGAQVPLGVGIAFAHKYRNTDALSLTMYGDGASNSGQVFEAFNMAKLWNLPVFLLCENNQYAMGTSIPRSSANPDFYTKGDMIPGIWVDGMDVISVREAARFIIEYISSGKGPLIMEANTYRYFGHSLSDPGTSYRTRDEIKNVRELKDPIASFRKKILAADLVSEEELKTIDNNIKKYVEECVKKVSKDKPVNVEELTHDIYVNAITNEVRGVTPFKLWTHKSSGKAQNK